MWLFENCLGLNLSWMLALTPRKEGFGGEEKIVRVGRTDLLLTEGKIHISVLLLLSKETPESAEHTQTPNYTHTPTHTCTRTHTHVSDSITALWDEGEILQPSALPIKLLLWVCACTSVGLCVTVCTCLCVATQVVRVCVSDCACHCVCLTVEVCVYGSRLWWRRAALQGPLNRDEPVCVWCVCACVSVSLMSPCIISG